MGEFYGEEKTRELLAAIDGAVKDARNRMKSEMNSRTDLAVKATSKSSGRLGREAEAGTSDWRVHIVEFGAKAHTIRPKKAGALAGNLEHPIKGEVSHPGFAGRPFIRPAFEIAKRQFQSDLRGLGLKG